MNIRQLVGLACAVLLLWALSAPARAEILTWGTIATADGEDQLRGIYDWELADLIAERIGSDSDILIVNTACYGGDFLDNFNDTLAETQGGASFDGHHFPNATIISGNPAGLPTYNWGWHLHAIRHQLHPGHKAEDVKNARHLPDESPQSQGDLNKPIGGANSTHILAWAGDPGEADRYDLGRLQQNFKDHPNTTIHALANHDASGGPTNGVSTGPATLDALETALDEIATMMGPGEQFIMYITDHGDIHKVRDTHTVPGGSNATSYIPMTVPVLDHMTYDPTNVPSVTLYFDATTSTADIAQLTLSMNSNAPISLSDPGWRLDTIVLPGDAPAQRYTYPLPENYFDVFAELSASSPGQVIELSNFGINPVQVLFTELGSGQLAKLPAPEPTGIVIVSVLCCLGGFVAPHRVRGTCGTS